MKKTKIIKSFEQIKDNQLDNFFSDLNKIMNQYMKDNSIIIIFDKKILLWQIHKTTYQKKF